MNGICFCGEKNWRYGKAHRHRFEEFSLPTPEETARCTNNAQSGAQVISSLLPMLQPTANHRLDELRSEPYYVFVKI